MRWPYLPCSRLPPSIRLFHQDRGCTNGRTTFPVPSHAPLLSKGVVLHPVHRLRELERNVSRLIIWGPNHKSVVPEFRFAVHACMAATDGRHRSHRRRLNGGGGRRRSRVASSVSRSLSISHADLDGFFPSLPLPLSLSSLVLPHDVRPRVRPCVAPEIMSGSFEFFATHFSTQCAAVMAQFSLRSAQPHLCR